MENLKRVETEVNFQNLGVRIKQQRKVTRNNMKKQLYKSFNSKSSTNLQIVATSEIKEKRVSVVLMYKNVKHRRCLYIHDKNTFFSKNEGNVKVMVKEDFNHKKESDLEELTEIVYNEYLKIHFND